MHYYTDSFSCFRQLTTVGVCCQTCSETYGEKSMGTPVPHSKIWLNLIHVPCRGLRCVASMFLWLKVILSVEQEQQTDETLPSENVVYQCVWTHHAVCVCPAHAVTFQCLDLQTSFFIRVYIFRRSKSGLSIKFIGSRSRGHSSRQGQTSVTINTLTCRWSAFNWMAVVYSCFTVAWSSSSSSSRCCCC